MSEPSRPARADSRHTTLLAVHSGALGDVILFGRLVEQLAPAEQVTLVSGGEKARLLEGLGVVGRAIDFDALPMQEIFTDSGQPPQRLSALLGEHRRLVSCFATGDARAQMRLAAACEAEQAAFLPIRPEEGSEGHLLELWLDLLGVQRDAGMAESKGEERGARSEEETKGEERRARSDGEEKSAIFRSSPLALRPSFRAWPVPKVWRRDARGALKALGVTSPSVVLHVGAGSPRKCWPLENYIALAWRIMQEPPRREVVFTLGPAEVERLAPSLLAELKKNFPVLECPPLRTLAGLLAEACAYVGNDSGVSHLAAAVGARCLALFGPTNPAHFRPLGTSVRILQSKSMDDIAVAKVLDELTALIM